MAEGTPITPEGLTPDIEERSGRVEGFIPESLEAGLNETIDIVSLSRESKLLSIEQARALYPNIDQFPTTVYQDNPLVEYFLGVRLAEYGELIRIANETDPNLVYTPGFKEFAEKVAQKNALKATESMDQQQKLYKDARVDPLTGIPNRRALFERLKEQTNDGVPTGILILDLDKFKSLNDEHGHPAGDFILVQTAQKLLGQIRQAQITMPNGAETPSNPRESDLVARFGGEEFVIAASGISSHQELSDLGNRLVAAINSTPMLLDTTQPINVTASIGGALFTGQEEITDTLKRADNNLYASKAGGRNKFTGELPPVQDNTITNG